MTRRSFRAPVDAPRPLSAVGLVAVASATLALTGEVSAPAVVLQGVLLTLAILLRERPLPLQSSAVWLNAVLLAIVALTLGLALRGTPSLVALAHFALLASGLQLLDARPRRSEFLLVALALFEVILASNLTDSLLFAPLLAIFMPAAVWTLVVHTLRTEAIEAGDREAASRVLTSGLLGTTLVASLVSMLLALALFFVLPRTQAGIGRSGLLGGSLSTAGFSDRVELGARGRIRGDTSTVMRVRTLSGDAASPESSYWRGLAFDQFDGRVWSMARPRRQALPGDPEFGLEHPDMRERPDLVQDVVREGLDRGGVVFARGRWQRVTGPLGRLEEDAAESLFAPNRARMRVRYVIESRAPRRDDVALRTDRAVLPRLGAESLLALPPLDPAIAQLATQATAGATSDGERALRLESWLRDHGHYTDTPPAPDPNDPRSPLERFLLGARAGHCEYFASALVVMARTLGLPARVVNGYAGGRENAVGGFIEIAQSDAHAWGEIHFERAGWVRFDATPPDLRLRTAGAASLLSQIEDLRSTVELWWFDHFVDFDRVDQMRGLAALLHGLRRLRAAGTVAAPTGDRVSQTLGSRLSLPAWGVLAALALGCGVAVAFGALVRARRRADPRAAPRAYAAALRLLARRGLVRDVATPARHFAADVRVRMPGAAGEAFGQLTEAYLAARFGGRGANAAWHALDHFRSRLRG